MRSKEIEKLRDGIIGLRTRSLWSVSKRIISSYYKDICVNSDASSNYDLMLSNGKRVKLRFASASKKSSVDSSSEHIIEQLQLAQMNAGVLSFDEAEDYKFNCNIQQLKPNEFDVLLYGIYFSDYLYIFEVKSKEITDVPAYKNCQHRDNTNEHQFSVTNHNLADHVSMFYNFRLTYNNIYNLLENNNV